MGEEHFSLIDLKPLSEPVSKLIESIGKAIGTIYEPTKIHRKAKAEADATIILAKHQAEIKEIEIRASERSYNREIRRQKNIEKISQKALAALPEKVSKEVPDEDWINQFFQHCEDIGNEDMQSLWGRILAGEVATPGTFSLRTLGLVKEIQ